VNWPIEVGDVRAYLGDDANSGGATALAQAVAAVVAYVPTIPALVDQFDEAGDFDPPDDVILGAVMLAARWYSRRGAILGTAASYADMGGAQILRQDPDIARLLRLYRFDFGAPTPTAPVSSGLVWP
jgi:hypothetical protein